MTSSCFAELSAAEDGCAPTTSVETSAAARRAYFNTIITLGPPSKRVEVQRRGQVPPQNYFLGFLAYRHWFRRVGDDASSSVVILSPPPIPNKTLSTGPEDKCKGTGGRCKETLNFATGGFLSPETSCLPPKRSVNPGPTSLLPRFAEELRRARGPMN